MRQRRVVDEYQVKVTDDAGIGRAKIPSPLIRHLGARPGDYMVFRKDEGGRVMMTLARAKRAGRKAAGGAKSSKKGGRRAER